MENTKPQDNATEAADLNKLELDNVEFVNVADGTAFPEGGASCCGYSCCCCSSSSCC